MTTPASAIATTILPCSFCGDTNAAVLITGQLLDKPLCLLHYYTTRAVRSFPASRVTTIGNGRELQLQLPLVQSIFSEAFTELKHEISEEIAKQSLYHPSSLETVRYSQEAHQDPLSMLHSSSLFSRTANNFSGKKKLARHRKEVEKSEPVSTGIGDGFILTKKVPHRIYRNANSETIGENSESKIGNEIPSDNAFSCSEPSYNPFKRRKPCNSFSYWDTSGSSNQRAYKAKPGLKFCSRCGSCDFCVNTSNTDMARGEVLENSKSYVMHSLRCLNCGEIRYDET